MFPMQAPVDERTAEKRDGVAKGMSAMMLPRAVALAKAAALSLPASPAQGTHVEAPARSSRNAMVRGCLHSSSQINNSDDFLASI